MDFIGQALEAVKGGTTVTRVRCSKGRVNK